MPDELESIRRAAAEHQREIDVVRTWLKPAQLATRWNVSVSTVKAIPASELPFKEFGRGLKLKRRRYDPADVDAYEQRKEGREGRTAA